jgi:hypothetical protein
LGGAGKIGAVNGQLVGSKRLRPLQGAQDLLLAVVGQTIAVATMLRSTDNQPGDVGGALAVTQAEVAVAEFGEWSEVVQGYVLLAL